MTMTMTMTTTNPTNNSTEGTINVVNARSLVKIGDKLYCKLTRTFDGVGMFTNATVEKDGKRYSVSGLFKDLFGEVDSYVWGEVTRFDAKGKIGFKVCEAPMNMVKSDAIKNENEVATRSELEAVIRAELLQEQKEQNEAYSSSLEAELNKAKEEMRLEFEAKLKEAEVRMKQDIVKEETKHVVSEIAKITGTVSPIATELLANMFEKASAAEIGKAVAIVAANHDSSKDFVMKMEKLLWGCL